MQTEKRNRKKERQGTDDGRNKRGVGGVGVGGDRDEGWQPKNDAMVTKMIEADRQTRAHTLTLSLTHKHTCSLTHTLAHSHTHRRIWKQL